MRFYLISPALSLGLLYCLLSCSAAQPVVDSQHPQVITIPINDSLPDLPSTTPLPSPLVIESPAPLTNTALSLFSGVWQGVWGGGVAEMMGYALTATTVVEVINDSTAQVIYSWGKNKNIGVIKAGYGIVEPKVVDRYTIEWATTTGIYRFSVDPENPTQLLGVFSNGERDFSVTMKKYKIPDGTFTPTAHDNQDQALPISTPSLTIAHPPTLLESPLVVTGATAGETLTLSLSTLDRFGTLWTAKRTEVADSTGMISIPSLSPIWYTARRAGHHRIDRYFEPAPLCSLTVSLLRDRTIAATVMVPLNASLNYTTQPINDSLLLGTLYSPKQPIVHGAIYMVASEYTPLTERYAELFASRGFMVVCQSLFNDSLKEVPMEALTVGINYLKEKIAPFYNQIPGLEERGVNGFAIGRGSEAILFHTSQFNSIKKVALLSPTSITWMGTGMSGEFRKHSTLSLNGTPVPFLPNNVMEDFEKMLWESPYRAVNWHSFNYANATAVSKALIPAHTITGELFLASGTNDPYWNSTVMANAVAARGDATRFTHTVLEGAGHLVQIPMSPVVRSLRSPLDNREYQLTDTPTADGTQINKLFEELITFYKK
ncbi:MAG: hypothetical protein OCD01_04315 [Fibrobacterales bacterium]